MFENWISPPPLHPTEAFGLSEYMLGRNVRTALEDRGAKRTLGLVGLDAKWADRVRRHLYRFAKGAADHMIYDLGDFRKIQPEFVLHALRALVDEGICPVVIGSSGEVNRVAMQQLTDISTHCASVVFHESVPGWACDQRKDAQSYLFGVQQHLLDAMMVKSAESTGTEIHRLGLLRDRLENAEPEIRDAGVAAMDLSSLRVSDMPGQIYRSTSGFDTEEACRLMRYCGQSTALRAILISGHDPRSAQYEVSANATAQLLWYFIDAFHQSVLEQPEESEQFQRYLIHHDEYGLDLSFYKSHRTGRWWVDIPAGTSSMIFSCAHGDYQLACEGKVSERLIRRIRQSLQHCEQAL